MVTPVPWRSKVAAYEFDTGLAPSHAMVTRGGGEEIKKDSFNKKEKISFQ